MDEGADLKLALTGNVVNRCNEPSKIEVDLSGFDCRLSRLNRRFGVQHRRLRPNVRLHGIVQVLLAGSLLLGQRRVLVHVELGLELRGFSVGELCLSLYQLSLGLIKSGLKGTRIDLKKQLAFLDKGAF